MHFFILLSIYINSTAHPIHISVTDVEIKSDTVYWTSRIYKDDLLLGMYGKSVDMKILDDRARVEKGIFEYLTRNVSLSIDGNTIKWKLHTIESDPEAIWITLHGPFTED